MFEFKGVKYFFWAWVGVLAFNLVAIAVVTPFPWINLIMLFVSVFFLYKNYHGAKAVGDPVFKDRTSI